MNNPLYLLLLIGGTWLTMSCQSGTDANNKNTAQAKQPFRSTNMSDEEKALLLHVKQLMEGDMLAETIEDANNMLAKYPKNVDALNYRGLARARTNNLEGGIKDFDEAISIDPNFVRPHCNKGLALYKLGDKPKARQCFDKAIEIDPEDAKSYFNRGLLNFEELKKGLACIDWKKAVELGYDDKLGYYKKYCEGEGVPVTRPKEK